MTDVRRLHVNEVGTILKILVQERDENDVLQIVDLASMVQAHIAFVKGEGGEIISRALWHYTDGTDGLLVYIFQEGDLDTEGRWDWQMFVQMPSGKWYSRKSYIYVDDVFETYDDEDIPN